MTESQIEVAGPCGPLRGSLLCPDYEQGLVALIIPGSGATDRDGNGPNGLCASTYRLLAEGLGEFGITSLRIDKRGSFGSSGAVEDPHNISIEGYVEDVCEWATALQQRFSTSGLWLLGHSEGGLVATIAAQKLPHLCGLVLLSTPGRTMGELLRQQLANRLAEHSLLDQALAAITAIEAGHRVEISALDPSLQSMFGEGVQHFLVSASRYNPADLLRGFTKPVLILQGQRDLQVSGDDALLLKAASAQAALIQVPRMNHVLKSIDSDRIDENLAAYTNPNLPLAPGLLVAIVRFMKKVRLSLATQRRGC